MTSLVNVSAALLGGFRGFWSEQLGAFLIQQVKIPQQLKDLQQGYCQAVTKLAFDQDISSDTVINLTL
jgi:hypothetical protein